MSNEKTENFYDTIASKYDWLFSDWNKIKNQEMDLLLPFLREKEVKSILDCACGTGMQSIGLLEHGFKVLASDISKKMIDQAIDNAKNRGLVLNTIQADFRELKSKISTQFDAIICMGNSLSHLLTNQDLKLALKNMRDLLNKNGFIIIEIRNFDRLLEKKNRFIPLKINDQIGNQFVTIFYVLDFLEHICRFNVIYILQDIQSKDYKIDVNSVDYNPIKSKEFISLLEQAGFFKIKLIEDEYFIKYIAYKQ
ncbi:MAG: class I SAM-dependent methyltransferase [Candidatus Lokiarchaeota archaeon]|nr:class I SAM-dependent methyltransferase [Candidatus Lokiarchaeota archaeon]